MFDRPVSYLEATTYDMDGAVLDVREYFGIGEPTFRGWLIRPLNRLWFQAENLVGLALMRLRLASAAANFCSEFIVSLLRLLTAFLAVILAARSGTSRHGGGERASPWLRPPGGQTDHYAPLC